ncbi:MAG TPA: adenylate/guanylate cyclase domain-containing protein [Methylomirabilota bacterium]
MDAKPKRLVWIMMAGNLLGAVITQLYFSFIDYTPGSAVRGLGWAEIAFFVVGFAGVGGLGLVLGRRWSRPVTAAREGLAVTPLARRRALLLPYALAGFTAVGWALAGLVWGVIWPLIDGTFSMTNSLRSIFGITCIAGTITTAFIFLTTERRWRPTLAALFPEGGADAVAGVPRFPVRARLLLIFVVTSVVPLLLLGVLAYTRASALVGADRTTADALVGNLLVLIVFLLAVGTVAVIGLSVFVSASVAAPLRAVQGAMAEVERGNLAARCAVVTNDELGAVAEGFNRMVHGLRERERLRETFGQYVTPEIRDEILAGRVALDGALSEVTILFADLRDFTTWVEGNDPREILRDLNAYFSAMEGAIRRHGGLVLQYIGDEIEAVFGAPVPALTHADMAVAAAVEMRTRLAAWNEERRRAGKAPIRHGIGIHTGMVIAGNVGSAERRSYALVGDPVNLASRIQGLTRELGAEILISGETRKRLTEPLDLVGLPAVRVKGKAEEVEVYRLP